MKFKITKEVAEHIEIALPAYVEDPGFGYYKVYEKDGQVRKLFIQHAPSSDPSEEPFVHDCELYDAADREHTALLNAIQKKDNTEYCSAKGMKLITQVQFNAHWKHVASLWHQWFLYHLNMGAPEHTPKKVKSPEQIETKALAVYQFETGV